jgi:hypothetical protein
VRLVDADFLFLAGFYGKMELYHTRYQYAVYKHDPDHVHLVISRIDINRKVWDDSYSYLRAMKVCRELEIEHNLTPVTSEFNMFGLRLTREEAAMEKRTGRPCSKRTIFDSVNEVILSCRSLRDMEAVLSEWDITMRVDLARGVSFGHNGFAFAGGRISRSCTLPCIQEQLAANSPRMSSGKRTMSSPCRGRSLTDIPVRTVCPREVRGIPIHYGTIPHHAGSCRERGWSYEKSRGIPGS